MTVIVAPIFEDAEAWLKDALPDMYVDGISPVYRTKLDKETFTGIYADEEEDGVRKEITLEHHVEGLKKLVELVANKKLFVGGVRNPMDLVDMCNWDVEVVDAYFQLLYHGEVIYG
jgi:hypothetical protein